MKVLTVLAALCFSLWISPETVVKNCRSLCRADGFQLHSINHVHAGYSCVCSGGGHHRSSRILSTPKTVWVAESSEETP